MLTLPRAASSIASIKLNMLLQPTKLLLLMGAHL